MRTRFIYYVAASLLLAGCAKEDLQIVDLNEKQDDYPVFTASMEQAPTTKTFVDDQLHQHWNAGDCITVFSGDAGYQYQFDGEDGDISGTFSFVKKSEYELVSTTLNANYAVFPYSIGAWASSDGALYLDLPYIQNYSEGSFGPETNTMVAATDGSEDRVLDFKNIYGYLTLKLYGEGIIKSITLKGNNGEAVAGYASVSLTHGSNPVIEMDQNGAYDSIILDCGEGVTLGRTADTATEFWLCIPPITFSEGFTISVAGTDGCYISKKVSGQHAITRNTVNPMASLEIVFDENNKAVPFDDVDFKAYCVHNFDTDGDGEVSLSEAEAVSEMWVVTDNIESLGGIECFQNLTKLICIGSSSYDSDNDVFISNGTLTSLDISHNTVLTQLECHDNKLDSLDVSNLPMLTDLRCDKNNLKYLNINGNAALQYLSCYNNQLTSLDASNLPELRTLYCYDNNLQQLNVSGDYSLSNLRCQNNLLTSLNASNFTDLYYLNCSNNNIQQLNVSGDDALEYLYCYDNQLTSLDVSGFSSLIRLYCYNNNLQSLNVSGDNALEYLYCHYNQLTSIELGDFDNLIDFYCHYNRLTSLEVGSLASLDRLACSYNTTLQSLDVHDCPNLTILWAGESGLSSITLENLPSLGYLECENNQLTSLDLSECPALSTLYCHTNNLTSLNLSNNPELQYLDCIRNHFTSLDLSNNPLLETLYCSDNNFTELDVSCNPALTELECACSGTPYIPLQYIYIAPGQQISGVTYNRYTYTLPAETEIVVRMNYETASVDLGLSVDWCTCNLGATSPEQFGAYYAWGETDVKSEYSWGTYKWCKGTENSLTKYCSDSDFGYNGFVDNKSKLEFEDDAAYANLGTDYRIPSCQDWYELLDMCTWDWTSNYLGTGVSGYIVTSTVTGYTDKSIFLPAAGYQWYPSCGAGQYMTSEIVEDTSGRYYEILYFEQNEIICCHYNNCYTCNSREQGTSIRPVKIKN